MDIITHNDDYTNILPGLADKSIDAVICDLPYAVTNTGKGKNEWDKPIDLNWLFTQYRRIVKDSGAIVLHSMMPFSVDLINAGRDLFKYEWIWEKAIATGFLNAKRQPLRKHESVLVFYKSQSTYNPQWTYGKPYKMTRRGDTTNYGNVKELHWTSESVDGKRYPTTILEFAADRDKLHPTQKPLALVEYMVKTYTNEGDTILDNCMGSGTTLLAAKNLNRKAIGIEKDPKYYQIALERIFGSDTKERK